MNILDHYLSAPRPRDFKRLQEAYKAARFGRAYPLHLVDTSFTVHVSKACIVVKGKHSTRVYLTGGTLWAYVFRKADNATRKDLVWQLIRSQQEVEA